jgi:hypothetical protein
MDSARDKIIMFENTRDYFEKMEGRQTKDRSNELRAGSPLHGDPDKTTFSCF